MTREIDAKETSEGRRAKVRSAPRIGVFGPLLGGNPGRVMSQGQILVDRLLDEGYEVRSSSSLLNRASRTLDLVRSALTWGRQIDVAVVMVFSGTAFWQSVFAMAPILGSTKIVLALHGGNLPAFAERHPRAVRRLLDRAHSVVAPSRYLADFFESWGYSVQVIPNVIDLSDYEFRLRRSVGPKLFWMRAFIDIYSPETAVRALALVRQKHPEAHLTMAGQDGDRLQPTKDLACRLGLKDHIRFPGFLSATQKRHEFAHHDIYLHTNLVDNMPVSVVEACASGLPVVASRVGGIPHLLEDGVSGMLVDPLDAAAISDRVTRLIHEPALAAQLSKNGRGVAEASSWDTVGINWRSLLEGLL